MGFNATSTAVPLKKLEVFFLEVIAQSSVVKPVVGSEDELKYVVKQDVRRGAESLR
jgi:hypothetical protein